MLNGDTLTVEPRSTILDAEHRYLEALKETLAGAKHFAMRIHEARCARGAEREDMERLQDELIDIELGIERAKGRRVRDLGIYAGAVGVGR